MAPRISTHEPGIQQDNIVARIFSFLDPQQNKRRLQELGAPGYVQTQSPQPPNVQPDASLIARQPAPTGGDNQTFGVGTPIQPNAPRPDQLITSTGASSTSNVNNVPIDPSGLYDPRVAKQIIDQYVAEGYDPRFAAGQAANAMIESAGNPTAFNKEEGAFGLFQHRLDRLDNMRAYADRLGKDINDVSSQISFSLHEYATSERLAYDRIMGGGAQTAADYARLIDQYYERSDGAARNKRAELASQIYGDFFGEGGSYAGGQEILSFGTEIDPYGTEDDRQRMLDFDPSMLSMGETGPTPFDPMQEYFLGEPVSEPTAAPGATTAQGASGEALPLSMGEPVSSSVQAPAQVPTTTEPVQTDESTLQGPIQSFLDRIYNTSDLSDEERRIRRRSMVQAFAEGLNYLTRGQADLSGVYQRASEAYEGISERQSEERRAAGVAQMAESLGLGQIAGLAYMGESARNSLTNAIVSSMSSKGKDDEYDLDPEAREMFAQQIEGYNPALAQTIRTATGKTLEDAMGVAMDFEAPTGGESEVLPSASGFAQYAREQGASEPLVAALESATTAQEVNTALDQLATEIDPAAVREFQYMQTLPPEQQRQFLEYKRSGAGGEAPEDLAREAVLSPIRSDIERFSEQSTDLRNLATSAKQQQLFLANPANTPNSLQAAAEPAIRLLQPILPEGFFEGAVNDQELLANRVIEGLRNSNLGNLASGVPGQLSNLEGERLLSIMAGAGDRRIEGLALTQFIQRNAERQQVMNDARANYLANPGPDGYTTRGYEQILADAARSVPVFRELTLDQYVEEASQYDNETMPLDKKSEVIMVRMPNGEMEFRTFGIYPEDE